MLSRGCQGAWRRWSHRFAVYVENLKTALLGPNTGPETSAHTAQTPILSRRYNSKPQLCRALTSDRYLVPEKKIKRQERKGCLQVILLVASESHVAGSGASFSRFAFTPDTW